MNTTARLLNKSTHTLYLAPVIPDGGITFDPSYMTTAKILLTRKWPESVEQHIDALYDATFNPSDLPLNASQLQSAMQNYDAVLSTVTDNINADILNTPNKRCRMIAQFGVGYNNIDIATAKHQGLQVTNTPDVLTDCTADIAMLLLLMSARRAPEGERLIRENQWTGWGPTQLMGDRVSGKTLGLIGFGRIGQAVAHRAHFGFGMNILFYNRSMPSHSVIERLQAKACTSIEEVLKNSDFVSLHCPGGAETRHLINEQRLSLMRPNAHLINTARGDVIDSKALIHALQNRVIGGAGLDVFEGEPDLDPDFLNLPNVALLPHMGSASKETRTAMGERVLLNINAFFAGQQPPDRII